MVEKIRDSVRKPEKMRLPEKKPQNFLPLDEIGVVALTLAFEGHTSVDAIVECTNKILPSEKSVLPGEIYGPLAKYVFHGLLAQDNPNINEDIKDTGIYKITEFGKKVLEAERVRISSIKKMIDEALNGDSKLSQRSLNLLS